jgi:hypothetical protein
MRPRFGYAHVRMIGCGLLSILTVFAAAAQEGNSDERWLYMGMGLRLGYLQQGLRPPQEQPTSALVGHVDSIVECAKKAKLDILSGIERLAGQERQYLADGDYEQALRTASKMLMLCQQGVMMAAQKGGKAGQLSGALNAGIVLGWMQQGAARTSRSAREVLDSDLAQFTQAAQAAEFTGFEEGIQRVREALAGDGNIASIYPTVTALVVKLREQASGQAVGPQAPAGKDQPVSPTEPGSCPHCLGLLGVHMAGCPNAPK